MIKAFAILPLLLLCASSQAKEQEFHDDIQYKCYDGTMILNCRVIAGPMRGVKVSCGWPTDQGGTMFVFGRGHGWEDMKTCWPYEPR